MSFTFSQVLTTFFGAALFPLMCRLVWGRMVDEWGAIGGWMGATFVVGTMWLINHGITPSLIHQTGSWVDMGLAAGIGCWVATYKLGFSAKKSIKNLVAAVIGAVLGAVILYCLLG
ncbi:Lin0368 family putative glycerol transporter subunit [Enterobacter hormaechei]|uniref:Lin0368 family putative glycerol transporter subunit n=1 Tax=Enterobacter hormaechei TaxID=158836 RepID=UPI002DBDD08D|nr:hypothetical protein [Enterobacter hormaechei]MEB7375039.1 hypothetical protein [Enterobacter hormaechei]